MILSVLPNVVQGVVAAFGDFYTWKLAENMYGIGSNATYATVSIIILQSSF
jgi:phosphatidylinositol glycan class B